MSHQSAALSRARMMLESQGRFPGGALPGDISDSWLRSLGFGLDPLARSEGLVLTDTAFRASRADHADLIHFARPELELLFDQIAGSNFMIALGSPDGVVLDTLTDGQFADTDAGRAVIAGSVWTEATRGTNALGLCIINRAPTQIYGGEHFLRAHGDVSCISAPIFDGRGGLAGVLDASSGSTIRQQHTAALVQMSASNIENSLIRATHDRMIVLQFHPRPEYLGTLSVGMLVLDEEFRIHAVNRRGEMFLTGFKNLLSERFDRLFDRQFEDIAQRLLQGETLRLRDRMGSGVSMRCVANRASFALAGRQSPVVSMPAKPVAVADREADPFRDIVMDDPALRRALSSLPDAARKGQPICLIGQSGTGKETYARIAHAIARKGKPFVAVDAATLNATQAVTTLLGQTESTGLLAEAVGGSLYLGDMTALAGPLQLVIARLLEQGEYRHPMTGALVRPDVLFLLGATTAPAAADLVPQLRYAAMGTVITLPLLNDRSDLPALALRFARAARADATLGRGVADLLAAHDWPGNLRELRAAMAQAAGRRQSGPVQMADFAGLLVNRSTPAIQHACASCKGVQWKADQCLAVRAAVRRHDGNVTRAAQELGMSRTTVYKHLGASN